MQFDGRLLAEEAVLATYLNMSMDMSTARCVSPLTGVVVSLIVAQSSSDACRGASDSVTLGWVRYLCLKKTVWPIQRLLVSMVQILWHL